MEKIATVERLAYGDDDVDVSAEDSADPDVNNKISKNILDFYKKYLNNKLLLVGSSDALTVRVGYST